MLSLLLFTNLFTSLTLSKIQLKAPSYPWSLLKSHTPRPPHCTRKPDHLRSAKSIHYLTSLTISVTASVTVSNRWPCLSSAFPGSILSTFSEPKVASSSSSNSCDSSPLHTEQKPRSLHLPPGPYAISSFIVDLACSSSSLAPAAPASLQSFAWICPLAGPSNWDAVCHSLRAVIPTSFKFLLSSHLLKEAYPDCLLLACSI